MGWRRTLRRGEGGGWNLNRGRKVSKRVLRALRPAQVQKTKTASPPPPGASPAPTIVTPAQDHRRVRGGRRGRDPSETTSLCVLPQQRPSWERTAGVVRVRHPSGEEVEDAHSALTKCESHLRLEHGLQRVASRVRIVAGRPHAAGHHVAVRIEQRQLRLQMRG